MKILVCVKQVPKEEDLKLDPETKTLIRSKGKGIISEYDKYAIEMALRLKEKAGGSITAVTMGPPQSAETLRWCLSMGVDDAVLLSDRLMGGADAYATATTLAAAVRYLRQQSGEMFDLILCGKQAADSDTSLVMPQLAEALGLPQVSAVSNFEYLCGNLAVERKTERTVYRHITELPAVISVDKTAFTVRYPNIKLMLEAKKYEIPLLNAQTLGLGPNDVGTGGSKTTVGASYFPEHNKSCVYASGDDSSELAKNLLDLLAKEKVL